MEYTKNQRLRAKIGIFLVALVLSLPNTQTLILTNISETFPDASMTQIQGIFSVFTLAISVSTLAVGILSRKINEKVLLICGILIMFFSGIMITAIHGSLLCVYVSAAGIGIGNGMAGVLFISIIMLLFDESERPGIMGLYGAFVNIGGLGITLLAGKICTLFSWVHVYYLYGLFALGAVIIFLFVPKIQKENETVSDDVGMKSTKVAMITRRSWLYHGLRFLITLVSTVFTVTYAMFVVGKGMGSTEQASWVFSAYSIAVAVTGFLVGRLAKAIRNCASVVVSASVAIALLCIAVANNILLVLAGAALVGFGIGVMSATVGNYIPLLCDSPVQITTTVSINTLAASIGAMIAATVVNSLTAVWTDDMLSGPFYTGAVLGIICTLLSILFDRYIVKLRSK